ncbi:hypothetical protein P43SY_009251 [Pythium insidiosum]|uniref:Tubby C-terminal domain-containing protein n=1 Tax=Pythium insidiosum TaxID=114742 RepID=A0AAD5Q3T8_PYTIN|nr:hypothetical protein P43SY_009251 [Pythium insidiosum]
MADDLWSSFEELLSSRLREEQQQRHRRSTDADAATVAVVADADEPHKKPPKKKRVRIPTERRREQCRRNQARYRAKERERVAALESALATLRGQVARLATQQRALLRVVRLPDAAAQLVATHTTLFARGYRGVASPQRAQQLAFVAKHMSPLVRVGDKRGHNVLLEQALLFTTLFDDFHMALRRVDVVKRAHGRTVLRAAVTSTTRITPTSLEAVFPAVLPYAALRAKLTGARLSWDAAIEYEFDEASTIVGMDWTIDLIAAFCGLLTLEEIALVFQDARIVRESYIVTAPRPQEEEKPKKRECVEQEQRQQQTEEEQEQQEEEEEDAHADERLQDDDDYLRGDDSFGWERLPNGGTGGRGDDTEDDVADDELNDGGESVTSRGYHGQRFDDRQYRDLPKHEEPPSIAQKLLTRLASFVSSPTAAAALTRKSSFSAPPRSYDSYDVTFEKGPIGLELETDCEDSAVYLGEMVPNFIGTEFTILDHQQKRRNELGFIEYDTNVFGRVPNYMKVVFPKQPHQNDDDGDSDSETDHDEVSTVRPRAATTGSGMGSNNATFNTKNTMMDRNGTISERYRRIKQTRRLSIVERLRSFSLDDLDTTIEYAGTAIQAAWRDDDDQAGKDRAMRLKKLRASSTRDTSTPYGAVEQEDYDCDLLTFETKKPSWNEELGAWTLNFQGRVKMASKKNFLVVPEVGNDAMEAEFGEGKTYLRFGKVTKARFALDYQAPMSPIIALAIACSSFAHKIAVT